MLKKVISTAPMEYPAVWLNLAKLKLTQGDYAEAVKYLQNVRYIDKKNPYYYFYIGMILNKKGDTKEANKYFKKALELKPNLADELNSN